MSKRGIEVSYQQKFARGCENTEGIKIEIEETDDGGETKKYMIWLSVGEARDLTQRLYDILRAPKPKLPPGFQ